MRIFRNFLTDTLGTDITAVQTTLAAPLFLARMDDDDQIFAVLQTAAGVSPVLSEVVLVSRTDGALTMARGEDSTAPQAFPMNSIIYADMVAGALAINAGVIDQHLVPEDDDAHDIGSLENRLREVYSRKLTGVTLINNAFTLPDPPMEGTAVLRTGNDTNETDPGCFEGTLCANRLSLDEAPGNYNLVGGDEGDAIFIERWNTGEDGNECRLISYDNRVFNALLGSDFMSGTSTSFSVTINNVPNVFINAVVENEDRATGRWASLEFTNQQISLLAEAFYAHLRNVATTAFTPSGILSVQDGGYIPELHANRLYGQGAVNLTNTEGEILIAETQFVKHNLDAAGAPAATNNADENYSVGSLWVFKGLMWRCFDAGAPENPDDENGDARWLPMFGGDGFIPIYAYREDGFLRQFNRGGASLSHSGSGVLYPPFRFDDFVRVRARMTALVSEGFLEDTIISHTTVASSSFTNGTDITITSISGFGSGTFAYTVNDNGNAFTWDFSQNGNRGSLSVVDIGFEGSYM